MKHASLASISARHKKKYREPFAYRCHSCATGERELSDEFVQQFYDVEMTRAEFGDPRTVDSLVYAVCYVKSGPGCLARTKIRLESLKRNIRDHIRLKKPGDYQYRCSYCAGNEYPLVLRLDCVKRFVDWSQTNEKFGDPYNQDSRVCLRCSKCSCSQDLFIYSLKILVDRRLAKTGDFIYLCPTCSKTDEFTSTADELQKLIVNDLDSKSCIVKCHDCGVEHATSKRSTKNKIRVAKKRGSEYRFTCFVCISAGDHYVEFSELHKFLDSELTLEKFGKLPDGRKDMLVVRCHKCNSPQSIVCDSLIRNIWMNRKKGKPETYTCFDCAMKHPDFIQSTLNSRRVQHATGFVSSLETSTIKILESLNIVYDDQFQLGPYLFDFFLPEHKLLIEVQGAYWHNLPKHIRNDASKFTFVNRYFPEFKILYLLERYFLNPHSVIKKISDAVGMSLIQHEIVRYSIDDVSIRILDPETRSENSRVPLFVDFLNAFHYAQSGRQSRICFGAFYFDELIAVGKFSRVTRSDFVESIGVRVHHTLELDRFCVHPNYERGDLIALMLESVTQQVFSQFPKISTLIFPSEFASIDTLETFRDAAWAEYKIPGIRYYVDQDSFVFSRKKLANLALQLGVSEADFVKINKYKARKLANRTNFVLNRSV